MLTKYKELNGAAYKTFVDKVENYTCTYSAKNGSLFLNDLKPS